MPWFFVDKLFKKCGDNEQCSKFKGKIQKSEPEQTRTPKKKEKKKRRQDQLGAMEE